MDNSALFDLALTGVETKATEKKPEKVLFDYTLSGLAPPDKDLEIGTKIGITISDLDKLSPHNVSVDWVTATKSALMIEGDIYKMETLAELVAKRPVFIEGKKKNHIIIWHQSQLEGIDIAGRNILPIWKVYEFVLKNKAWSVSINGKRSLLVGYEAGMLDSTTDTPPQNAVHFWEIAKKVSENGQTKLSLLGTEYEVDWNVPTASTSITPVWTLEKIFAMNAGATPIFLTGTVKQTVPSVEGMSTKAALITLTPIKANGSNAFETIRLHIIGANASIMKVPRQELASDIKQPVVTAFGKKTTEQFYAHNTAHVEAATAVGPGVNTSYSNTLYREATLGLDTTPFGIGGQFVQFKNIEGMNSLPWFDASSKQFTGVAETMTAPRQYMFKEKFEHAPQHSNNYGVFAY